MIILKIKYMELLSICKTEIATDFREMPRFALMLAEYSL